jgi:hypothetical protein
MANAKITSSLVSIQWLAKHLDSKNPAALDASMKPVTLIKHNSAKEGAA